MNKEYFRDWCIVAGPCSAETREQVINSAIQIKSSGGDVLRAGLWKPRTNPNSWQGCGDIGIDWMIEAKNKSGLAISTEVIDIKTIEKTLFAGFDMIWIGSRNGQNYSLLEEVGKQTSDKKNPIILKRSMSATLEEWLGAAEYITKHNSNVILCERGIRGFSPDTRNTLDLQTAKLAQKISGLPVIIDVSHAAGRRDLITPMSLAVKASGFNGLMVEVCPDPNMALTDNNQQISLEDLNKLVQKLNLIPSSSTLYDVSR